MSVPGGFGRAALVLDGTGEPLLDAQPFSAKFDRQSFRVHTES